MMYIYDTPVVIHVIFLPQLHHGGHRRRKKLACWAGVGSLTARLLVGYGLAL